MAILFESSVRYRVVYRWVIVSEAEFWPAVAGCDVSSHDNGITSQSLYHRGRRAVGLVRSFVGGFLKPGEHKRYLLLK